MPDQKESTVRPTFGMGPGPGASIRFANRPKLKDGKGALRRIIGYLSSYKRELLLSFGCSVAVVAVTIVGTRLNGYTVDTFIAQGNIRMLGIVCLVMLGMYLVGAAASCVQNLLMISASQKTSAAVREDLFKRVQRLPLSYFDTHSSGDVMSRLTNDVDNINTAISQTAVQLFTSIVSVVGMLIAMLLLNLQLTLVCLLTVPVTFLLTRSIARYAQGFFVGQQRNMGELNGYIEEMVSGQKVLRLFSRESAVVERFEQLNQEYVANAFKAQSTSGVIGPCNGMINNFSYLLVAVTGGICIIKGIGGVTVGVVFSFLLYMRNFTNPINNILTLANALQLALASAERVFETIDEVPEYDGEHAANIERIDGDVALVDVDFSYVPGKPVLQNASIEAAPGQTVAVVGPTGAGKTTIISLLMRFYDVVNGSITLDGRPIETITRHSLRQTVSLVLQDTFLFSDTIGENIRYGRLNATDEEVITAAKQAHAHEFIMQLPKGYDTVLLDNGQNLSQGQRQLLNIARSIISHSSILILDEATSSVDTRTEQAIQSALLELMRGKTSFVIAHRLSTIKNADKIVVIDKGHVVEQGSHSELLELGGFYAQLYESQFRSGTQGETA